MSKKLLIAAAVYAVIGLVLGSVMAHFIPAMNILGVLYYALLWPLNLIDGTFHLHLVPMPDWLMQYFFTFDRN